MLIVKNKRCYSHLA